MKRKVEVVIISDVHLGTYGSKALPLLEYLNSIEPKIVVLNGDIIDGWQFSRKYFPTSHVEVVKKILDWVSKGTQLYYVTGNHDEMMRKFVGFGVSNAKIVNKVVLQLDGKQVWIFHGDVFDVTMRHSKWIAKMGADGYGFLILLNKAVNSILKKVGKGKISLSKQIKNSVKSAVKSKNNFETTAAEIAIQNGYDYVICGHIHQPIIKDIEIENEKVCYLNSGDWVENMTALEYKDKKWTLYVHKIDENLREEELKTVSESPLTNEYLFEQLLKEFE
ncbi:MAG: UDP-2,3-diacylglucosamine hydrolase [Flexibacter sp. CG_4_10_14_3_um_filter_32_15]|nr:MAG: UDP-2,3-diacylglucosamine hydrolase [Flexibacter sp. CG_4_10_14_3_um_filter_32_15]